jgi:hypothetical protein
MAAVEVRVLLGVGHRADELSQLVVRQFRRGPLARRVGLVPVPNPGRGLAYFLIEDSEHGILSAVELVFYR